MDINYAEIDSEIRTLVWALNNVPGIETTSSCSGHGKEPCRIYFRVTGLNTLHRILFNHFNTVKTWRITLDNADVNVHWDNIPLVLESLGVPSQQSIDIMTSNFANLSNIREVSESLSCHSM